MVRQALRYFGDDALEVASILLDEGAVLITPETPFTFASGIVSPMYCDLRLLMRSPGRRRRIAALLAERVEVLRGEDTIDVVAGVATAGIPWAAWVAEKAGVPMAYVRDSAKEHGRGQQVEGGVARGQSAVVVEDLTSTGASAITAVEGLRLVGVRANRCISIFTYESPSAARNFQRAWVSYDALCGVSAVLRVARETGRITVDEERTVQQWLATGPMSR